MASRPSPIPSGPSLAFLLLFGAAAAAQTLPPVPVPPENPITEAKRILGKILFWDEQLSSDNTMACGTCHFPEAGGGDFRIGDPSFPNPANIHPGPDGIFGTADDVIGATGVTSCGPDGNFVPDPVFWPNRQVTGRKTPSFIGAQWDPETFWDGRAGSEFRDPVTNQVLIASGGALENQAVGPPVSSVEMACLTRTLVDVADKIAAARPLRLASNLPADMAAVMAASPTYPDLFNAAFGTPEVSPARIGMAIATYERTLVPDQTPFDAFMAGNPTAISMSAQNGFLHFTTPTANCSVCHDHTTGLFTDHSFRNIGVRPDDDDIGREAVTMNIADRAKFKVPGLRNVALRAPFFHAGTKPTLVELLVFYGNGGDFIGPNIDTDMIATNMSQTVRFEVEQFLLTLTDPRVAAATFPFDRPTLFSEGNPNPVTFGSGTPGLGGVVPMMLAPIPPIIGSDHFGVGLALARPAAAAAIFFSFPGPPTNLAGGLFFVRTNPAEHFGAALVTTGLPSDPAGAGAGSFMTPIPDDPFFDGLTFFGQWVVADAVATAGLALSDPVQFTFVRP